MSSYMLKQASRTDYNYKEFYCDTAEDVAKIDIAAACPGSIAYVIATQDVYILNNNKQWIKQ